MYPYIYIYIYIYICIYIYDKSPTIWGLYSVPTCFGNSHVRLTEILSQVQVCMLTHARRQMSFKLDSLKCVCVYVCV